MSAPRAVDAVSRFRVGERVRIVRDLPSLPAGTEGTVLGVLANATGVKYAIRFDTLTRIVVERDLGRSTGTSLGPSPARR